MSTGERLHAGRYELAEVVGTGAFSTVHRAVDQRLEDVVAIKILAENHSLNPELHERFLTEGRVLRRVRSENLLTVYDLGETGGHQPFLVLEYADRGTLAARVQQLRQQGWQPGVEDLIQVAKPLSSALGQLHEAGIVHRDLNPKNVLIASRTQSESSEMNSVLGPDERLVVGDLGLCKDLARHSGYTVAAGTDGFRAPELRRGPTIVSPTADLWSLSAVMYWVVTGKLAEETDVAAELAVRGMSAPLIEVLRIGLAEDPRHRYQEPDQWFQAVFEAVGSSLNAQTPPANVAQAGPNLVAPLNVAPASGSPGRPGWFKRNLWWSGTLLMGFTTWAVFLYIGLRARRGDWIVAAGLYGAGLTASFLIAAFAPELPDGSIDTGSRQSVVSGLLLVAVWLAGMVHGFIANPAWQRFRFSRYGPS